MPLPQAKLASLRAKVADVKAEIASLQADGPSPDGTRIVLGGRLIDPSGVVWTIRADAIVLRDGVATNGYGTQVLLSGGSIYVKARTDAVWWRWLGTNRWLKGTTADPSPTPPTLGNFDARKSGAVRWFDFASPAQLGGGYGANYGIIPGSRSPVLDNVGGIPCLRFDFPSQSGGAPGDWFANFSADLGTQFGENTEFFVQWRQRFNQAFLDTVFMEEVLDADGKPIPGTKIQGGIKQVIITTGDQPGRIFNSCEAIGNVVQTYYQHPFPQVYNSCTGSGTHQPYTPMFEVVGNGNDYKLQNVAPSCLYTGANAGNAKSVPSGCVGWIADEWMTFQVGTTVGPRNNVTNDFDNSRTRLWIQRRAGEASQLVLDWKPGVPGYFPLAAGPASDNQRFGKIWLTPYMTHKDSTQVHPLCSTLYGQLIIARQQIADPT